MLNGPSEKLELTQESSHDTFAISSVNRVAQNSPRNCKKGTFHQFWISVMVLLDGNLQLDVIGTGVNICGKFH